MIKNEDNCVEMFIDGVGYIGGNAHQGILYKKVYTMLSLHSNQKHNI